MDSRRFRRYLGSMKNHRTIVTCGLRSGKAPMGKTLVVGALDDADFHEARQAVPHTYLSRLNHHPTETITTMPTYDLTAIKKLSKNPTPANLGKLRRIASEQTERRDNIVMRDMALGYARKVHGDARWETLKQAQMCRCRIALVPYGNRPMRRAAERAVRKADKPMADFALAT